MEIIVATGHIVKISPEDKDLEDGYWSVSDGYAGEMHRVVAERMGLNSNFFIDHRNGDPLDNRRENLREATRSQNAANSKISCRNTSGFKGVSFDHHSRNLKKWRAECGRIKIGRYSTREEAAQAYNKVASAMYGEYAKLNNFVFDLRVKDWIRFCSASST